MAIEKPRKRIQTIISVSKLAIERNFDFFSFYPDWFTFTNLTSTESPPHLRAVVGPEMSSDSNVYDAMARFVRGRDGHGLGAHERPKCTSGEFTQPRKRRQNCALNADCFGNASNPWHPDGDCQPIFRWSRRDLEDSPRFRNLSVVMFGDSRIRVIFGALQGC